MVVEVSLSRQGSRQARVQGRGFLAELGGVMSASLAGRLDGLAVFSALNQVPHTVHQLDRGCIPARYYIESKPH